MRCEVLWENEFIDDEYLLQNILAGSIKYDVSCEFCYFNLKNFSFWHLNKFIRKISLNNIFTKLIKASMFCSKILGTVLIIPHARSIQHTSPEVLRNTSHQCVISSPTSINNLYENIKSITKYSFWSPSWKYLSEESDIIFKISKVLAPWRFQLISLIFFSIGNDAYTHIQRHFARSHG